VRGSPDGYTLLMAGPKAARRALTAPLQSAILRCAPEPREGSDAFPSMETARGHHAFQRSRDVAAPGAGAAAMPVIGFLSSSASAGRARYLTAFRQGLRELGYVEGQNVTIEYRWAQDQADRLPDLAADLVRRQVTVIAADTPSSIVAKAATTTIPIVYTGGGDPVKLGLVPSLNRPGGNVTGITFVAVELGAKQLGLLHELQPGAVRVGVLVDPNYPTESFVSDVQAAAFRSRSAAGCARWRPVAGARAPVAKRSLSIAYADRPMIGMRPVWVSFLRQRTTSQRSSTGISRSIRMTSGRSVKASLEPCSQLSDTRTSKSSARSRRILSM
jgi:hypothetical protein